MNFKHVTKYVAQILPFPMVNPMTVLPVWMTSTEQSRLHFVFRLVYLQKY